MKKEIEEGYIEACERYDIKYVLSDNIDKINGHPSVLGMQQIEKQIINKL